MGARGGACPSLKKIPEVMVFKPRINRSQLEWESCWQREEFTVKAYRKKKKKQYMI